jgi:hypothetical protein
MPYRHPPWRFFDPQKSSRFLSCRECLNRSCFVLAYFSLFESAAQRRATQGAPHKYGSPVHAA